MHVRNADRPEAAAGDEQPGKRRELPLDRRHPLQMADLVLRALPRQPEEARRTPARPRCPSSRQARRARSRSVPRRVASSRCGSRPPPRKPRSRTWPSGARPGHFDVTQVAASSGVRSTPRHHETAAAHRMSESARRDSRKPPSRSTRRAPLAQPRQRRVEPAQQSSRDVSRHREDHRLRAMRAAARSPRRIHPRGEVR